jgi:hypothetical protein
MRRSALVKALIAKLVQEGLNPQQAFRKWWKRAAPADKAGAVSAPPAPPGRPGDVGAGGAPQSR